MFVIPPDFQETPMSTRDSKAINDLLDIMAKLRDPDGGCPWD